MKPKTFILMLIIAVIVGTIVGSVYKCQRTDSNKPKMASTTDVKDASVDSGCLP